MTFNSLAFVVFFAVVYSLYLALMRRTGAQNWLLLIASYVFYGWWDVRFLGLMFLSTVLDFFLARSMDASRDDKSRLWLVRASVATNLGILGFFKYFNFFADSFTRLFHLVGFEADAFTLQITLPVGISFYTFQGLSYTIDVYRRELAPVKSFRDYALFVAFFPQLVAGPIERAAKLLPQLSMPRVLTAPQFDAGLFLLVWGYFKKVVIADNASLLADRVFNDYTHHMGLDLLMGALAFTVQIYADFSGYTDIARGLAKLMGFDLCLNFRLPYFAVSPSDFWRRWHISLSSWLRDYLYIPLGGNRKGSFRTSLNLFLTMLLGGLWHGAAWNFVAWGAYHGGLLIAYRAFESRHAAPVRGLAAAPRIAVMFTLTVIGWVLFRAHSLDQIVHFMRFSSVLTHAPTVSREFARLLAMCAPLVVMQLAQHRTRDLLAMLRLGANGRGLAYFALVMGILVFGRRTSSEFIYFQF